MVQFMDGGSSLGAPQALNASGQAALSTSTLNAGTHSITASYSGDTNFNRTGTGASTASPLSQVVNSANTSVAVSSSLNPSIFGQPVTFTATVTNASGTGVTPTGSVQFVVDGSSFGGPVALNASGVATSASISNRTVNGSPHTIAANYTNSDGNFNNSNGSLSGGQIVNKATTSTGVTSSVNPSVFGQGVTFTATVTNTSGTGVTPTGSAQFVVDGVNFGSPVALNAAGTATSGSIPTLSVSGSPHSVTASYMNADGNFNGSNGSLTGGQTVNKASTSVSVTSSGSPSVLNAPVTFTANISVVAPGAGTPTGTVTFTYLNGALSGTLGTVTLNASGVATLTTSALPVNVNIVKATYSGDGSFNGSYGSVNQTVQYLSGGMCAGDVGHTIRQPINPDGTSVFKQKSTVPAKFAVCDANGTSIGTAGVVANFRLVQIVSGTVVSTVDESVDSTTPDTMFRWDPTGQQWIFNMNTKSLTANYTYFYTITLNDGSTIGFDFGLR
jgi:hypothetical protein